MTTAMVKMETINRSVLYSVQVEYPMTARIAKNIIFATTIASTILQQKYV